MVYKMETTIVCWGYVGKTVPLGQKLYMGGRQNYDPFLGTLDIRCRISIGIYKKGP